MQLELFEEVVVKENAEVLRSILFEKASSAIKKFGNHGDFYIRKYSGFIKKDGVETPIDTYWFCNRYYAAVEVDWTDFFKVTLEEAKQLVDGKIASQWGEYW